MPSTPPSAPVPRTPTRGRVFRRSQSVATKNGNVESVTDVETEGIGVRVLVDGAWGFAGDRRLTDEGARDAARRACEFARAAGGGGRQLAPLEPQQRQLQDTRRDRSVLRLARREDRLLPRGRERARAAGGEGGGGVRRAQLERKVLVSSEGSEIDQEIVECGGGIDATAVADGRTPDPQLPERVRRHQRPGGLGVRRRPRARSARRRASASRPPRCCRRRSVPPA